MRQNRQLADWSCDVLLHIDSFDWGNRWASWSRKKSRWLTKRNGLGKKKRVWKEEGEDAGWRIIVGSGADPGDPGNGWSWVPEAIQGPQQGMSEMGTWEQCHSRSQNDVLPDHPRQWILKGRWDLLNIPLGWESVSGRELGRARTPLSIGIKQNSISGSPARRRSWSQLWQVEGN